MGSLYTEIRDMFRGPPDPRTLKWSLTNPWHILILSVVYLAFVLKIGPKFMKNRPAFNLNTFITGYNIVQIFGCIYMMHKYVLNSDFSLIHCQQYVPSFDEKPYNLAVLAWVYTCFKVLEFVETVVFVLRKKQNQVSFLHVYHHVSTLFFNWLLLRYKAGGVAVFGQFMNNFVHIIMYTYYLISTYIPPKWQKKALKFKKCLTALQLIQFTYAFIYLSQAFYIERCSNYRPIVALYFPNLAIFFYLFYKFYVNSYHRPANVKSPTN